MSTQTAPIPEQPVSTLVLPVSVSLIEYYKMADKEVPETFDGGEKHCDGVSFDYHFERDPLQLDANGRDVKINVSGRYRIKMNYCPECASVFSDEPHCIIPRIHFSCGHGEPMRRMQLQYTSHVELTNDYGLRTLTKLTDLKALDPCEVTVFQYDATDQLLKEVRKSLDKLANDIDKQTAAISFRPQAKQLWDHATTPIEVPGYGFVQLRPDALHLLNPVISNNVLRTSLVLEARPLFTSYRPEKYKSALPRLHLVDSLPNDTLRLVTDIDLGYDSLSVIINRFASGTKFMIKNREVVIDSVHIAGAQDRQLVFRVAFSGDKRGTLFLTGQPYFNAALQQIELKQVDFDLETKSTLLKTAEWLFSDRILDEIAKNSKQDLKPQLDRLLKELNKSLHFEQEGFLISGVISQISVDHVYPETDRLVVRVSAKGKLDATNIRK
jgi:Zn-finger nucleic acid-binding protein